MRVVCDNCAASYKIPDSKLTKEVNKATCRKCGHAIFIKRAGEEEPRPAAPPPAPHGEERTLITSAADLERAVRSRAGTGFDESADQRPTTVSLENQGEQTVPREPLAPSAFPPPPVAPSAFPPPPVSPTAFPPPPVAPPPALAPPPAAFAPAPRAAAAEPPPPLRPAGISPSAEVAPSPVRLPPPAVGSDASAVVAAPHDPRTDLSMALVALVVSVVGVLVLSLSTWLQSPVVAGLGAFLALFGTFVVALILVTGGRGTRAASLAVAFLGGLVLSGALGGVIGALLLVLAPAQPSLPLVAAATPPAAAPVAPPVVEAPPVAPPVVEAPPVAAAPAVVEAPPVTPPPAATPPAATTPPPASTVKSTPPASTTTPKASTATASKSSSSEAPARITPSSSSSSSSSSSKSTASTSSTKSTPPASTSSGSSSGSASSGVSVVVIDTMIKSNKAVKSCFVQQRNETGELPKGVKVKLTIQDSGKVSSASIPSGDLKGSDFDGCLSGAVKSIQFPPFEGDPVTVTYPFVF